MENKIYGRKIVRRIKRNFYFELISKVMAFIGVCLMLGAVSTSDYYLVELVQDFPDYIWKMMLTGFVLILPATIRAIFGGRK